MHFVSAIDKAKELDHHLLNTGHPIGPLHGVPVTFKDQFDVKGYDSTLGYVGRAFRPAEVDCVLVSLLRSLGAIPLAKTNLPQSIMVSLPKIFGNMLRNLLRSRTQSGARQITRCSA